MARPKKGQIFQCEVPVRASTDGSLITAMTASDFNSGAVCKWFGVNHGVSDAFTSGTMSKAARLVSSGLMQLTLNATENAYDEMVLRCRKTAMKPAFIAWNNADYDDSDLMSRLSDVASDLRSYAVETRSQLSDVQSYLAAMSGALSDVESQLDLVPTVNNSDAISNVYSLLALVASNVSDVESQLDVTTANVSGAISDVQSYLAAMSGALSDVESQLDLVPTANNSDAISNVYSLLALVASNVSDVESQLDLVPTANNSAAISDIQSYLVALSGALSDVESQLDLVPTVNNSDAISNVMSQLLLVASNVSDIQSAIAAGVEAGASTMSDLRSAIVANGMQKAGADPTGVIGVTDSYGAKIDWLTAISRNKLTQTSTSAVLHNDAGTAIASATVSDDGVTFERSEWH